MLRRRCEVKLLRTYERSEEVGKKGGEGKEEKLGREKNEEKKKVRKKKWE